MTNDTASTSCHVACHDTRDGFLSEIVVKESIDFLGRCAGLWVNGMVCDIELQGVVIGFQTDIVNTEPSPVWCNDNAVGTLVHDKGADIRFCISIDLERNTTAVDGQIDLFRPIKSVVADIYFVLCTFRGIERESNLGFVFCQFKRLSTRIFAVANQLAVGVCRILRFQLCVFLGTIRERVTYQQS